MIASFLLATDQTVLPYFKCGLTRLLNSCRNMSMHLRPETDYNYTMEENMIANTMEEKDLAIIIDNKLNF
jgi:hypothetical protein